MASSQNPFIPPEYRKYANGMTVILGLVAFALDAFFIGAIGHGTPLPSVAVLLLTVTFAAAAALLCVWQMNRFGLDAVEIRYLLRAGARAGVRTAFVVAALVVLATGLFASAIAALAAVVPALLSILPAAFVAMLSAAVAAGIRMPNARRTRSSLAGGEVQLSKAILILAGVCVAALLLFFGLPRLNELGNSRSGGQGFTHAVLHNSLPHSEGLHLPNTSRSSFSYQLFPETPPPLSSTEPFLDTRSSPSPPQAQTPTFSVQTNTINEPASQPLSPRIQNPTSQSVDPRTLSPHEPMYNTIWNFVMNHHQKMSGASLDSMINDYADQVVYFHRGVVDRAYIYRDEAAQRVKLRNWREVVIQPVTVVELEPDHYEASYRILYDADKRTGQHVSGVMPVYLFLREFPNGLKIVSQQVHLESGE
jgi:hypothetical protein